MAVPKEQMEKIREMRKNGIPIAQIAKNLKISRQVIYKYLKGFEQQGKQNEQQQIQEMQTQTQQTVQTQPAVSQIQKELVENAPEKEGDMLAKILSKYNLSQPLTTEEVNFLIGTLKKKYLSLDKVLQEELRQGAENEARKAFLAKISEIIDDALSLGIEMHYIAKDFEDFCKKKGMTFPEFVRVAGTQYITGQAKYEEAPSETLIKVLNHLEEMNRNRQATKATARAIAQLNSILLAKIIKENM
jgi:transposase